MYGVYVCLLCMPYVYGVNVKVCSGVLGVCLICMPYVYGVYVMVCYIHDRERERERERDRQTDMHPSVVSPAAPRVLL